MCPSVEDPDVVLEGLSLEVLSLEHVADRRGWDVEESWGGGLQGAGHSFQGLFRFLDEEVTTEFQSTREGTAVNHARSGEI